MSVELRPPFPLMGKGRGWGDLLSGRLRTASTAEITPPLPLPIEGEGTPAFDIYCHLMAS
ncbi:hypothetical protein EIB18_15820 [Caulobacter vibrioides]|uniref:Uncharacterized protein n=1 Tax=Caulobacter vibrioides (strain NA1000 / CB15N) TaxID=565050 RepID=A0A0H3ICT6_CAUVN|nr:hypothetical protein [Caulobacter vibrioides]YP_008877624.1 hypothetical protein CCNA_03884 [Caulobacter vibrioides NA1000]AGJ94623.1 hypothetical protein CCNA_03884 [Caulobacter vibrioides NA1000]ATC29819.1 hypothetical protein CA607_16080 [Caulobacter vibrioides]AZH14025.1 hypothetical protein EIB18_15820 [Caulobacter vibrioides]QXZ51335.1 hypothetical protein KZH45_15840 [Caulobacter vibrioides]